MKNEPIIIKNDNFTSINFRACFQITVNGDDSALVPFLPKLLIRYNAKYPDEEEFQKEKLKRNITKFGYYYFKTGYTHFIQFYMEIVDPKYIGEDKIEEAFELFVNTIYNPKLDKDKFDEKLYENEFEKLKQVIDINNKDIKVRAYNTALRETDDVGCLKNNVFIDNTLLDTISNKKLYSFYQKQIYMNKPLLFVMGDVNEEQIKKLCNKYINKDKKNQKIRFDYNQFLIKKDKKIKEIKEKDHFHQSALVTIYKIDDIKEEDKIMMFTVVNLFSSQSSNLIMKNLRGKAGLVYSAFSQSEKPYGLILILALINSKTKKQTLKQIDSAFNDIQNKEIITPLLENIVDRHRLNLLRNLDDKEEIINNKVKSVFGYDFTDQEKYDKLKGITVDDVICFVKRIKLDLIYFLKGEENEK